MKKCFFLFIIGACALSAEPKVIGEASQNSAGNASNWKNWAFAGGAGLLAGLGIYVLSIDQGQNPVTAH